MAYIAKYQTHCHVSEKSKIKILVSWCQYFVEWTAFSIELIQGTEVIKEYSIRW